MVGGSGRRPCLFLARLSSKVKVDMLAAHAASGAAVLPDPAAEQPFCPVPVDLEVPD